MIGLQSTWWRTITIPDHPTKQDWRFRCACQIVSAEKWWMTCMNLSKFKGITRWKFLTSNLCLIPNYWRCYGTSTGSIRFHSLLCWRYIMLLCFWKRQRAKLVLHMIESRLLYTTNGRSGSKAQADQQWHDRADGRILWWSQKEWWEPVEQGYQG